MHALEQASDALLIGHRGQSMPAQDITKHVKRMGKGLYPSMTVNAQTIRQSVIGVLNTPFTAAKLGQITDALIPGIMTSARGNKKLYPEY